MGKCALGNGQAVSAIGLPPEQLRAATMIVGQTLGESYEKNMNQLVDLIVKQ